MCWWWLVLHPGGWVSAERKKGNPGLPAIRLFSVAKGRAHVGCALKGQPGRADLSLLANLCAGVWRLLLVGGVWVEAGSCQM